VRAGTGRVGAASGRVKATFSQYFPFPFSCFLHQHWFRFFFSILRAASLAISSTRDKIIVIAFSFAQQVGELFHFGTGNVNNNRGTVHTATIIITIYLLQYSME
jgi:hypothetical protein